MKSKIYIFLLLAAIGFSFTNSVKATTTFNIKLTITDNRTTYPCVGPYTGEFYVRVFIILDGSVISENDVYIDNQNQNTITWVWGGSLTAYDKYQVQFDVCRYAYPNSYTCGQSFPQSGTYTMTQLTGGQPFTTTF